MNTISRIFAVNRSNSGPLTHPQRRSAGHLRRISGWILSVLMLGSGSESMSASAASPSVSTRSNVSAARASEPQPVLLPGVQYRLVAVTFREPRSMSVGAGRRTYTNAIEIQLTGESLATGSVPGRYTLNGFSTTRSQSSVDGMTTQAWIFGVTLSQLEQAARAQGGWTLRLQASPNAAHSYAIAPTGRRSDLNRAPVVGLELR